MKRVLFTIVLLFSSAAVSTGQITISESAFSAMFSVGGPIRFVADTTSTDSINVGHKGGPQTFDFSGLTLIEFGTDTIRSVVDDPFMAQRFSAPAFEFHIGSGEEHDRPVLIIQSGTMTQIGQIRYFTADSLSVRHSTPGELFLKFPIVLGDSIQSSVTHAETTFVLGGVSGTNSGSNTKTIIVDGYGTLLLPGGKSYPCLRLRDVESPPNQYKEFRFITENGGMLFIGCQNTEPDTGVIRISDPPQYIFNPSITSVERAAVRPTSMALEQNYPNPFNPETAISYQLSAVSRVRLTVYDILGRAVANLVDETLPAGMYTATWNASEFPSGVYLYKLETGGFVQTRKMILVK